MAFDEPGTYSSLGPVESTCGEGGWVLGTLWRIFLLKSPSWSVISGELQFFWS